MVNAIDTGGSELQGVLNSPNRPKIIPRDLRTQPRTDILSLGSGGQIDPDRAQSIVLERSLAQLRSVVEEARAELGLDPEQTVDTSPQATADRIADFALNFFAQYAENNGLDNDEAGRAEFVEFIGEAVAQGIDEARGILGSLNALSPEIEAGVDETANQVQARFDDFIANGS